MSIPKSHAHQLKWADCERGGCRRDQGVRLAMIRPGTWGEISRRLSYGRGFDSRRLHHPSRPSGATDGRPLLPGAKMPSVARAASEGGRSTFGAVGGRACGPLPDEFAFGEPTSIPGAGSSGQPLGRSPSFPRTDRLYRIMQAEVSHERAEYRRDIRRRSVRRVSRGSLRCECSNREIRSPVRGSCR